MRITGLFLLMIVTVVACKKSGSNGGGNQPDPAISISDMILFEGNSGTTDFEFTISLSGSSAKEISVAWNTEAGTAKAGEDFTTVTSQTIVFKPGETQKKLIVPVIADDLREGNDTFTVKLSNAVNGYILKGSSAGTIRNDDTKVKINNNGYDAPASYAGYTLAWSDEFNGNALDMAAWSHQNGDGCPNVCGWGNNELEYYTERADNLFFQDGKMIIEARPENYSGKNYTSSKILTAGKKVFKFGRIDFRAILPKGKGIWPAFWMLPQHNVFGGWPKSGEIDIMEMVGHEPNRTHGTLHFGPGPGSTSINRNIALSGGTFNDEFHVFSIEWKQDQLKWFLDGNLFSTINKADLGANHYPFNEDFFFIINLAVGGNWPGNPNANTYFPQWLIVDYVRVYQ